MTFRTSRTSKRRELTEQLAEVHETLGEIVLMDEMDETLTNLDIADAICHSNTTLKFPPVFGSAIKNTDVQPILDGVDNFLPNPAEREVLAHDNTLPVGTPQVVLTPAADAPRLD